MNVNIERHMGIGSRASELQFGICGIADFCNMSQLDLFLVVPNALGKRVRTFYVLSGCTMTFLADQKGFKRRNQYPRLEWVQVRQGKSHGQIGFDGNAY